MDDKQKIKLENEPKAKQENYNLDKHKVVPYIEKDRFSWIFLLALLPSVISGVYYFGLRAALVISISVFSALILDSILQLIMHKEMLLRPRAIVISLILSLILSPEVPLWIPIVGNVFILFLVYSLGNFNKMIFHPSIVGRVILAASFPTIFAIGFEASKVADVKLHTLFFGNTIGSIGMTSGLMLLLGGLILISLKIIDWRIPLFYLASLTLTAALFRENILFHIMSGAVLIVAFFILTSNDCLPLTTNGRILVACISGVLTVLIRLYAGGAGEFYAVLLMNAGSPFIESITIPKPFGRR